MRRVLLRLLLLGMAAALAVAAWVVAASFTHHLTLLAFIALVVFCLSGYILLRWAGSGAETTDRRAERTSRVRWLITGAVVYMLVAQLGIGRAPQRTLAEPSAVERTSAWTLGDAARLAYLHVPARGPQRGPPIVMLHDGPGIPALPELAHGPARPLDFAADSGFDVYYYDQRGAGLSDRLDLRESEPYSVERHVRDLEEIRTLIGAERLILAGHGWGATLAINYTAAHPERVAKLLLLAPAPLWYAEEPEFVDPAARARIDDVEASALALAQRPTPRLLIGRLTALTSSRAAHTLVHDWEADQWWTNATRRAMELGQPRMTCRSDPTWGLPSLEGLGFFAYSYTVADALRRPDPRPALARTETPALVVRGLCDFVQGRVAQSYLDALPGALYVAIPGAGHLIWAEQQPLFEQVASAFLLDRDVPLTFYSPRAR
ncbi:MAG TPA: alpha/beta hydrolase [Longimicrobiales bacterium]